MSDLNKKIPGPHGSIPRRKHVYPDPRKMPERSVEDFLYKLDHGLMAKSEEGVLIDYIEAMSDSPDTPPKAKVMCIQDMIAAYRRGSFVSWLRGDKNSV